MKVEDVAKELGISISHSYKVMQHHRGLPSLTGRTGRTESSRSPVGTSKAGILLPQVYGARSGGTAQSEST